MAADEYQVGSMDIHEKRETWEGFTALVKWSCIIGAVGLLVMRYFLIS